MPLPGQSVSDPSSDPASGGSPAGTPAVTRRRLPGWFRAAVAVAVVVPVIVAAGVANAEPTKTKEQLVAELEKTQNAAEIANERYMAAQSQLDSINVRIEAAKARQASQQKAVDDGKHAVGRIAAETYKSGDLAALGLLLSDNPDALLAQSGMMTTLGARQAAAVRSLKLAQQQLAADSADLLAQQQRLAKTTAEAKATKKEADAKNAAVKAQIARFNTTELAAMNASRSGVRDGLRCDDIIITPPNAATKKAIDYACAQIGAPYVWGAEGPSTFDCSGLTMAAYKAAGITLPRTTYEQVKVGTAVSTSNLRPGDLLFSNGTGHVGIYIGNNMKIHAPHTGDHVRIAAVRSGETTAARRIA
ncbi:MAG: NlpC/P60 family protein [Kineosporiaceae bacterium]